MRPLVKNAKPVILAKQAESWRDELLEILARGERPTDAIKSRYRHKDIKAALLAETLGKCAYCESKVTHIAYGDIEHIVPKSKDPSRAYDWANLTLACDVCNTNKGDHYGDGQDEFEAEILDPYIDDPAQHLLFLREVVSPRPDSMRGFATEALMKLSRGDLLEKRRERMTFLDGLVRAYTLAEQKHKRLLLDDLYANHLTEESEYSASSKAYVELLKTRGVI